MSIIKKPENDFENTFMKMVNKHSNKYLNVIDKYSEENIDQIIEGANNIFRVQKFAVSRLKIKENTLISHRKIVNKEAIVKQDREKQVDPINKGAYAQLEENEM